MCNPFAPLTQSGSADGATEWVTSPFVSDHDSQQSEVRGSLRVFVWVALQAVVVYAFSWAASSSATDTGLYVAAAPATVSLPRLAQAVPHRPSTSTRCDVPDRPSGETTSCPKPTEVVLGVRNWGSTDRSSSHLVQQQTVDLVLH